MALNGISFVDPSTRFDGTEQFIAFHDPDGMMLELIAPSAASSSLSSYTPSKEIHEDDNILAVNYDNVWKEGPINPQHAIRGFHSAAITADGY